MQSKIAGSDIQQFTAFLPGPDVEKWPDIRPTGSKTGYLIHPYLFLKKVNK